MIDLDTLDYQLMSGAQEVYCQRCTIVPAHYTVTSSEDMPYSLLCGPCLENILDGKEEA